MKIIKYFFVGGAAALVDVSLFFVFVKILNLNYLMVGFITFILATFINYYLSIKFVFISGKKFKKLQEIILIYFVSSISLLLNLCLLFIFHEFFLVEVFFSKLIVTLLLFLFNYAMRKYIIFAK